MVLKEPNAKYWRHWPSISACYCLSSLFFDVGGGGTAVLRLEGIRPWIANAKTNKKLEKWYERREPSFYLKAIFLFSCSSYWNGSIIGRISFNGSFLLKDYSYYWTYIEIEWLNISKIRLLIFYKDNLIICIKNRRI